MFTVELEKFKALFPRAKNPEALVAAINEYSARFGVDSKERMTMFLAQAAHESGGFSMFQESTNYSADGLANTWPTRYAEKGPDGKYIKVNKRNVPNALGKKLARNPQAIANNAYANRMGNGPESSGDGWNYRGRGIFQLTGKDMYILFTKSHPDIDIVSNPELLLQPAEAVISALWFWQYKKMSPSADTKNIETNTRILNGG